MFFVPREKRKKPNNSQRLLLVIDQLNLISSQYQSGGEGGVFFRFKLRWIGSVTWRAPSYRATVIGRWGLPLPIWLLLLPCFESAGGPTRVWVVKLQGGAGGARTCINGGCGGRLRRLRRRFNTECELYPVLCESLESPLINLLPGSQTLLFLLKRSWALVAQFLKLFCGHWLLFHSSPRTWPFPVKHGGSSVMGWAHFQRETLPVQGEHTWMGLVRARTCSVRSSWQNTGRNIQKLINIQILKTQRAF